MSRVYVVSMESASSGSDELHWILHRLPGSGARRTQYFRSEGGFAFSGMTSAPPRFAKLTQT